MASPLSTIESTLGLPASIIIVIEVWKVAVVLPGWLARLGRRGRVAVLLLRLRRSCWVGREAVSGGAR